MRPFLFDHEAETDLWATAPGIYNANGRGWRSPSRVGENLQCAKQSLGVINSSTAFCTRSYRMQNVVSIQKK